MRVALCAVAAIVGAAALASAQPPPPGPGAGPRPFEMTQFEGAFERQTVRGAPYTARTETRTARTLADGNRISGRWTGFVARDGEGRVRREQPLAAIGALLAAPDAPRLIVVSDPVARVTWFLDPAAKTARRMAWPPGEETSERPPAKLGRGGPFGGPPADAPEPRSEPLGSREIEGVRADGTRSTLVIPAGRFGNEREIEIVNERWSSPELDVVLETRHSDPLRGETRFRVTRLEKGEPDRALFEVPPDYRVEEGPQPLPGMSLGGRPGTVRP